VSKSGVSNPVPNWSSDFAELINCRGSSWLPLTHLPLSLALDHEESRIASTESCSPHSQSHERRRPFIDDGLHVVVREGDLVNTFLSVEFPLETGDLADLRCIGEGGSAAPRTMLNRRGFAAILCHRARRARSTLLFSTSRLFLCALCSPRVCSGLCRSHRFRCRFFCRPAQ
jgi:hypothetical protein